MYRSGLNKKIYNDLEPLDAQNNKVFRVAYTLPLLLLVFSSSYSMSNKLSTSELLKCLESPDHTLTETSESGYRCQEARNSCEIGFIQALANEASCASKPGCKFVSEECYCPPDVVCVCGGGAPPLCVPKS